MYCSCYVGNKYFTVYCHAQLIGGKSIGFLEDMARLNVGLTRAKLALILIGNLDTLAVSR
jgi:superfamily I DNA and/or RNA helicase